MMTATVNVHVAGEPRLKGRAACKCHYLHVKLGLDRKSALRSGAHCPETGFETITLQRTTILNRGVGGRQ
jgi:hypothetical protein